jgi:hypothetical protein
VSKTNQTSQLFTDLKCNSKHKYRVSAVAESVKGCTPDPLLTDIISTSKGPPDAPTPPISFTNITHDKAIKFINQYMFYSIVYDFRLYSTGTPPNMAAEVLSSHTLSTNKGPEPMCGNRWAIPPKRGLGSRIF